MLLHIGFAAKYSAVNGIKRQNKDSGNIERQKRLRLQPEGLSRYGPTLLNQGLIEQVLVDYLDSTECVRVEWRQQAEALSIDPSPDADGDGKQFPVTVGVRSLDEGMSSVGFSPDLLSTNQIIWELSMRNTLLPVMVRIAGRGSR